MKIRHDADGIVFSEVYSGLRIETPSGHFGIAQRDDGIEVLQDGKLVWSSNNDSKYQELQTKYEALLRGAIRAAQIAVTSLEGSEDTIAQRAVESLLMRCEALNGLTERNKDTIESLSKENKDLRTAIGKAGDALAIDVAIPFDKVPALLVQHVRDNQAIAQTRTQEHSGMEMAKDIAYAERDKVVALCAAMAHASGLKVGLGKHVNTPGETWDPKWRNLVFIDLPRNSKGEGGQVSWHFHDDEMSWFQELPKYDGAWDGHTTKEKYDRIAVGIAIYSSKLTEEIAYYNKNVETWRSNVGDKTTCPFVLIRGAATWGMHKSIGEAHEYGLSIFGNVPMLIRDVTKDRDVPSVQLNVESLSKEMPQKDFSLRELQTQLPWTIHYHHDFRASPMAHKDFGHALLHVVKATGKLAEIINNAERKGSEFTSAEVDPYIADLVVCALRLANTIPGRILDLQQAVEKRIEIKNSVVLRR